MAYKPPRSILQPHAPPVVGVGGAANIENGNEAERIAASTLVRCLRGEVSWGSRNADSGKIDLLVNCAHPWRSKAQMLLRVQVKSGTTYGEMLDSGFRLKRPAIVAARVGVYPTCLVWVSPASRAYWAYIHPSTPVDSHDYGRRHEISPTVLYDLARCEANSLSRQRGGRGVTLTTRATAADFRLARTQARHAYRDLQAKPLHSPVLGEIFATRIGWRHMTRRSRSAEAKNSSFQVIRVLRKVGQQLPSDHFVVSSPSRWAQGGWEYEAREHVLRFREVRLFDRVESRQERRSVVLRAREEIRYPKHWRRRFGVGTLTQRRVILTSAYHKPT